MSSDAMQAREAAPGYRAELDTHDVPPGYKRTDVGVIPDDWQVKRLGELGRVVRGGSPRPAGDPRFFNGSFIPWLTVAALTNLPEHEIHVSETVSGLTEEGATRSRTLVPGTLIIANSGATLGVAKMLDLKCCANDGIAAIVNHRSGDKSFLCYYVNTQTERLRDVVATGNGQPNLNTALISEIRVPFPRTAEQRAIAQALSDVDGLLGALEALIAKKRAIKQAAMQQLLTGKTRLPGFSGEWETKRLGDLADIHSGATPSTQVHANWGGDIPWCTPTDITGTPGKYLVATERRITRQGLTSCAATLLPRGALLLCSRATVGELKIATTPICTNQGFKSLVCKRGTSNEFLYYLLLTLKSALVERASGSTFLEIGKRDVASLQTLFPTEEEQTAIATVLSDMDAEIAALEARRDKTRAIKQGMMQQLLTGRIRLAKPEPQFTAAQTDSDGKTSKPHSWAFNEAVVISTLASHFGSEEFPLGRKRYQKLSYLLHRHAEQQAEGYLKKAAGPYNPKTKYGGPERIALESGYISEHKNGSYTGFVAAENIGQAEGYFEKWYGPEAIQWLEQFRFRKNDELELLATVDMAAEELRAGCQAVDVDAVKAVIRNHPEWKAKLDRAVFSDANIAKAIKASEALFDEPTETRKARPC